MIEILITCIICTLTLATSIGIYFFISQQKQITTLEKQLVNEQIETNVKLRLLEDLNGKQFSNQIHKMEALASSMDQHTAATLKELEMRFKGFKDNFMNNY
jgi:hypothetical protein|tara:strand:+ start:418 stop:720 length:303 start_codon:yes stop_codon:yes gene_type:complete